MAPVQNRLALHVEPILFLFVPFYWLGWGGPELLLVAQAVVVTLGAWPLFLLARPKLGQMGAWIICLAYLLYPPLEAAVLYDFHAVTLAPTFLLAAFYHLDRVLTRPVTARRWGWFTLFAALTMACKEDMGLTVAFLGVYIAMAHRQWRPAALVFSLGIAWPLLAIVSIQGQFGGNVQRDRYAWLLEAMWQPDLNLIWTHLWERVDLAGYLLGMFAPVAGLALLSPFALLPILPSLAINLLSSHGLQWRLEEFHYAAPIAPFIFIATVQALNRLKHLPTRFPTPPHPPAPLRLLPLLLILTASLIYHHFRGFTPLARPFLWREVTPHHRIGAAMAARLDPQVPLFTPLTLNPHVSSRRSLHQTFDTIAPTDWLWLDVATHPNQNGIQQFIRDELLPNYTVVEAVDGYLLLEPGPSAGALPAAFHTYARPDEPVSPQVAVSIFFGEALELIGYDLRFNRAEEVQVKTYWHAHQPLPPGLTPTLFLLDQTGGYLGATDVAHAPATLVWFPTQLWPLGETMVVDFNALNWDTRRRDAYRLALGVTPAADPWDVAARWSPVIARASTAPHLTRDRTAVQVAVIEQVAGLPVGGPPERLMQPPSVEESFGAVFGEQVKLVGVNRAEVRQSGGNHVLELEVVWQGVGEIRGDFVRFVHAVAADGSLVGQDDSHPTGGMYPTSLWATGEFVLETVRLPLPPDSGSLTLHLGLYDPASGQRLLTPEQADHVEVRVAD